MIKTDLQNGRSMIEMLGVLAIIGVLSVGGLAGYSKAMTRYKVNKTTEEVMLIANSIRSVYANKKNYETMNCYINNSTGSFEGSGCALLKEVLYPEGMWDSDTGMSNLFGGTIQVGAFGRRIGNDKKAFIVLLNKLRQNDCINLATVDWGSASGFISVGVNKDTIPVYEDNCSSTSSNGNALACVKDGSVPMSVGAAARACKNNSKNFIQLKFY
ncbi:MAG: type II secretion system protein [Alphaproteobacteria bacterium]|nr:type II secretion system protein [Alphaproteobacteria bacterium]